MISVESSGGEGSIPGEAVGGDASGVVVSAVREGSGAGIAVGTDLQAPVNTAAISTAMTNARHLERFISVTIVNNCARYYQV